jgi:cytochrome d ubiquinol oxidase subunit II
VRLGQPDLSEAFRLRALGSGLVAGLLAAGGLIVLHDDAHRIYHGLVEGRGLAALIVSALAGVATLSLVVGRRFEPARYSAALAVAAIVVGWALAQRPRFLPGLSIDEAAAGRGTLVAVIVAIAIGAVVLVPSLALLFGLVLRGRFDAAPAVPPEGGARRDFILRDRGLVVTAVACLAVGLVLMLGFDTSWARVVGVASLLTFVGTAFVAVAASVATADDV